MKHLSPRHGNYMSLLTVMIVLCIALFMITCSKEARNTAINDAASERQSLHVSLSDAGIDTGGLVAWYSFNNGSLNDLSLNKNNIVFSNAEPTTDRNGEANNAYHFNGTCSYMKVLNSPSLNPGVQVTLFAIVKFDDFYAGACHGNRVFFKGDADFVSGVYGLGADDGYTYNGGQNCYQDVDKTRESFQGTFNTTSLYDPSQFIQTGHWYHLVYTFGNGVANLYVDGKLVNSRQQHINAQSNSSDLYIGRLNNDGYSYWLNGSIDQIGIFNRTLNDKQIAKLSAY